MKPEAENPFGFRFMAPLALGSMLNPINSTMISTAIVPIATSLHASVADTGWIIAGLYLTSAIAQPTLGRLVDRLGPRRVFLSSLLFVAAAGIYGGFANTIGGLVLVRVLLGIGTSGAYPAAMRLFRQQARRYHTEPPRKAMGVLSLAGVSTTAVGPLLGGVLTSVFGWHAVFLVNVPMALLAALLILRWVPRDEPRPVQNSSFVQDVDLPGMALFTVFLLSLMAFLMSLRAHPLWWTLAPAIIFGAALLRYSLRREQAFIDIPMLLRNRPLSATYARAAMNSLLVYSAYYGFAQWLQSSTGIGSAKAGLVTLPMSVAAALSSLGGARSRSLRTPFLVCNISALAGCAGLFLLNSQSPLWLAALVVSFFGVPLGLFSTATQAALFVQAPAEEIGTAAGLQRTAQYFGAISAASLLALMYGQRATDSGLHGLALAMTGLSALVLVATTFDRTIPDAATLKQRAATTSP